MEQKALLERKYSVICGSLCWTLLPTLTHIHLRVLHRTQAHDLAAVVSIDTHNQGVGIIMGRARDTHVRKGGRNPKNITPPLSQLQ